MPPSAATTRPCGNGRAISPATPSRGTVAAMTFQEFIDAVTARPLPLAALLVGMVALAGLLGLVHGKGQGGTIPWRYVYTALVYAACVPGVFATLLTAYAILFLHQNLLAVNALVYFAPIVAMALTLWLIRRNVGFDEIPGFDRLWGLIVMLAVTFGIVFALSRLFFGVVFFGSIGRLVAIGIFVFALLKWGAGVAFRKRGDAPAPPPRLQA